MHRGPLRLQGEFADAGFDLEAEDDLDGFLDDEDDSAL